MTGLLRRLLHVIILLTCLATTAIALFYYLTRTESGLQTSWAIAQRIIPGDIHINQLKGSIHQTLYVKGFSYRIDGTTIIIDEGDIDANIWALLTKQIIVQHVNASRITIELPPSSPDDTPDSFGFNDLINLLSIIHINQASVNDLRVIRNGHILFQTNTINIQQHENNTSLLDVNLPNGHLNIAIRQNPWTAQWQLNIPNVKQVVPNISGSLTSNGVLNYQHGNPVMTATLNAKHLGTSDYSIGSIEGTVSNRINNIRSFNADLQLHGIQLKFFKRQLDATVKLDKSIDQPLINAQLSLNNSPLTISEYNTQLSNLRIQASYQNSHAIKLNGNVNIGQGQANINGDIHITQNDILVNATVKGNNLQIANTSEYHVIANPDLTFKYSNHQLDVSGSVNIPSAIITPTDFRSTVTLPSDVIIVNQPSPAALPLTIGLSVQLSLGDRIRIKYQNLSAKIAGTLHITQQPGSPARAIGELSTSDGTYKGYGKNLTIETGRLIYTGNLLSNPGIDVRAIQRIRSVTVSGQSQFGNTDIQPVYTGTDMITVGIWIRGTLNHPILNLFSEPAGLSQGDILSYLLLGYPQSQASGASSLALLNMVSSGQGGAADVTSKMQNVFGLTEFGVGSTEYYDTTTNSTQSATTVNVGRNLGHNLSLHYNIGLFTSVSIFSLRYQISKHFALQSETSELENGGDLLYQVEGGD